nr:ADP,ATP carrier protein 1, mitochondrial-like [Tanacetum cinerariifolium]
MLPGSSKKSGKGRRPGKDALSFAVVGLQHIDIALWTAVTTDRSLPTVSQKLGLFGSTMTQADLSMIVLKVSPICLQAPAKKGSQGFTIDFLMGRVSAVVSKTAVAPIERGSYLCGEETLLTSYVTSLLRLLTFLSFKRLIHQLEASSVNLFARDKLSDVYFEIEARLGLKARHVIRLQAKMEA